MADHLLRVVHDMGQYGTMKNGQGSRRATCTCGWRSKYRHHDDDKNLREWQRHVARKGSDEAW